jgi:hypothetical protein
VTNRARWAICIVVCIGIIAVPKFLLWYGARPAPRPSQMPANSVWIYAPALPFSWHHGWWLGCWIDSDGRSNRCRLWAPSGIVYEGRYISCESRSPVLGSELQLKAPQDSTEMWVGVKTEAVVAPAVFLQNGKALIPIESAKGCEELIRNRQSLTPD